MSPLIEQLHRLLPSDRILTAPEDLIAYSYDGTPAMAHRPLAVVFPTSTEETAALVKVCAAESIPLVTRGSGTGLAGGSIPVENSIVLCLTRFNRILEVDRANLTLRTEPGATTQEIAAAAEQAGLFYPPDPGSMKISTIGGNVANNSGGLRGLKYGVTRDYVMALEVVLAGGEVAHLGSRCVKDVAGYSLRELFIGSEGTLGVITQIILKLLPKPAARKTLLAVFDSMEGAAATVSAIIAHPIIPCTLEFLDRHTIRCVEDFARIGLPTDAEAIVLMETDGHPAVVEAEALAMSEIAQASGARTVRIAANAEEAAQLAAARRTAFSALARVKPTTILEDVTVSRSDLARTVRFIQECAARHRLMVGIFGHFGDGNIHPTFLTDERNMEEMHRVETAMMEIVDFVVQLGGTITGEHGVGIAKKPFLPRQFDDASMRLLREVKRSLDPKNILNPGKIFDL